MKNKNLVLLFLLLMVEGGLLSAAAQSKSSVYKPWSHGQLKVSKENRYLMNADGTPFFWLGDTGWLLPEKLNRDEAAYYLEHCRQAGFNVVQVQTINGVPAMNFYGQYSMIDGFNFKNIDRKGVYGYWDHMDYIIQKAEQNGIYIAMVCIWGGLVRSGKMNVEEAKAYGRFLGERYKDAPNIIWVIGGDTYAARLCPAGCGPAQGCGYPHPKPAHPLADRRPEPDQQAAIRRPAPAPPKADRRAAAAPRCGRFL